MTGERLGWFQVASHLKIPVSELKQRIGYREFVDWITFLRREEERDTKQDVYLAQIAAEIRRGSVANPKSVKVKDFLMSHSSSPKEPAPERADPRKSKSKKTWAAALGVQTKKEK